MFQFFTTTELYYERRLLDLAHNRISPGIAKHFYCHKELHGAVAVHLTGYYYLVKYECEDGRAYHVDAGAPVLLVLMVNLASINTLLLATFHWIYQT